MIETISKKVSPSQEQSTINLMTKFGWTLKSSQEIYSKDSHLERKGDTLYNVTEKENYVKLLFERDTHMQNYQRIAQLEKEYYALLNARPSLPILKILGIAVLCVICFPIGIYLGYKTYKEISEQSKNWKQYHQEKAAPIFQELNRLI